MMNILKRNIKIKLVSILCALIMWIYVMAVEDPIIIRDFNNIPVNITNMDLLSEKNMTIIQNKNLGVNVMVRGRRSLIKEIYASKIKVYGKINNPKLGQNTVQLYIEDHNNIDFTIIPNKFNLNIEKNVTVKKNIEIDRKGTLGKSIELSNISLSPNYTFVEGPKSIVDKVDKLVCKIDLENKSSNFIVKSKIIPIDKGGNKVSDINLSNEYARVTVGVFKTKEVPVKLNIKGTLGKDYRMVSYNPNIQKVTIMGKSEDVENIQEINTEYFDISDLNQDKKIDLNINIPENIKTNTKKISVNFDITKIISKDFLISKNRIVYNDNLQNLDISKNDIPENIKIKLVFSEDLEKEINEEDIQLFIKMQDYKTELAKYEITYNITHPVESVEIEPKYVKIAN